MPSVLSEASLSCGVPPAALAGFPPLLVTASVMATAAMMTTTAAPIPVSQLRRLLRAASWARISATFARAAVWFALLPRPLPPLAGFPVPWFPLPWFPLPWFPPPWFPLPWFPLPWFLPPWFPRPLFPACLGT